MSLELKKPCEEGWGRFTKNAQEENRLAKFESHPLANVE